VRVWFSLAADCRAWNAEFLVGVEDEVVTILRSIRCPAEGHLFDLLEPEDVVPAWKRWSPILLRPEGLYGTRPVEGGNKAVKLKAIREALSSLV
jgi:hypothetical protein